MNIKQAIAAAALGVAVVVTMLAGCHGDNNALSPSLAPASAKDAAANTANAPASTGSLPATDSPDTFLSKGMAYVDARQALLAHGWEPAPDPGECKSDPTIVSICDEIPELTGHTGDRYMMRFRRGSQLLYIEAEGNLNRWKSNGRDTTLSYIYWQFLPQSADHVVIDSSTASAPASTGSLLAGDSPRTFLSKNMDYLDARRALLAHGWEPAPDPECKSDPTMVSICDEMPELNACGAGGYCMMYFKRDNLRLEIQTFGDIGRWKSNDLLLTYWRVLLLSSR